MANTLFFVLNQALAGNPVLYSLDKPFPSNISTQGGSVTSTYTFTNNLPFTFRKPFQVTPILCSSPNQECTATEAEFKYKDQCTGKKLQPKESCTYSITLTPNSSGRKTVLLAYGGYDNNVVHVQPALTTDATTNPAGLLGTTNFPSAQPLPSQGFTNTNYTVTFTFTNYEATTTNFTQKITLNNNPNHPNFSITSNSCIPSGTTGSLASGQQCSITGVFNSPANGSFTLAAELIGNLSSNTLSTSITVRDVSFNQLIGVDYNPNHYSNNYPFNFHDVFYTGTLNNPAATNVYAELQQLQNAGFTTVRSYQTEPYSWIDLIKQANALGMKVIYEAVIPQLPQDTNYPGCPLGAQKYIPCAAATLNTVIQQVSPEVFNNTVILVLAGHENYCNAGDTVPPCTGTSNISYLTTAVSILRANLAARGITTPVGSAVLSGNFVTPSPAISADMQTLINSYSPTAPLAYDPYPFQFGVSPATAAIWTPPLSSRVQPTNSLAWDYIKVVGSTTPRPYLLLIRNHFIRRVVSCWQQKQDGQQPVLRLDMHAILRVHALHPWQMLLLISKLFINWAPAIFCKHRDIKWGFWHLRLTMNQPRRVQLQNKITGYLMQVVCKKLRVWFPIIKWCQRVDARVIPKVPS